MAANAFLRAEAAMADETFTTAPHAAGVGHFGDAAVTIWVGAGDLVGLAAPACGARAAIGVLPALEITH